MNPQHRFEVGSGVSRVKTGDLVVPSVRWPCPHARCLPCRSGGQGFCVNLSVDTGSTDIMELCNELGALYIDTVNEPWLGFYFDASKGPEARSNYALREAIRDHYRRLSPALASAKHPNPGSCWVTRPDFTSLARSMSIVCIPNRPPACIAE